MKNLILPTLLLFASPAFAIFPQWWNDYTFYQRNVAVVTVKPTGGVKSYANHQNGPPAIVSGQVTFQIELEEQWSGATLPPLDALRYQLILHVPDSNGLDQRYPLSGELNGPQTINWDSQRLPNNNSLPDGTYAISVKLLGAGSNPATDSIDHYVSRPYIVVVDNSPGPVSGDQWVPLVGTRGHRGRWAESYAVDWLRSSPDPLDNAHHPYPYQPVQPLQSDFERNALVGEGNFFPETWLYVHNARYDRTNMLTRSVEGHLFTMNYYSRTSSEKVWSHRYPFADGRRNQASINKRTTFRPDPDGPGFYGISYEGRLFHLHPTNGVTTLAGQFTRLDRIPYSPFDDNGSPGSQDPYAWAQASHQWIIRGNFSGQDYFRYPFDLAIDPNNSKIIYIADTDNHAIRKVDVSGPEAVISTFAGQLGNSGSQDGTRLAAQFNRPRSIEIVGDTMYVADEGNKALRTIDLNTDAVSTEINDSVLTGGPYWIRRFSNGDLAMMIKESNNFAPIFRVKVNEGYTLEQISGGDPSYLHDIDWKGVVGPVDDMIYERDHGIRRRSTNGTETLIVRDAGGVNYQANSGLAPIGTVGAYAISVAIDDVEPRILNTAQYQRSVHVLRPKTPTDLVNIDTTLSSRGRDTYMAGTIREFFPNFDRPSMSAFHGRKGHNLTGQPTFDDMSTWTDREIADYIRDGMGGQVPRPEITGSDLQAMIYFIRVHSIQGKKEYINPDTIKSNLSAAGYWNSLADQVSPGISNIQVQPNGVGSQTISFTTDEPAVSVVHYGLTQNHGLNSPIQDNFQTNHSITLTGLDPATINNLSMYIRVRDQAGNQNGTFVSNLHGLPPTADDQPVSVDEDNFAQIQLTGSDPENNTLTFELTGSPQNGTLSNFDAQTGLVRYTPDQNYFGSDSFGFRVNDGSNDSPSATILITVNPQEDVPSVQNQSVVVLINTPNTITLGDAQDVDGDALTYSIVSSPQHGTLSGSGVSRTYTPNQDYEGDDSFTFRGNDGKANSNVGTISITVRGTNQKPVALNQSVDFNSNQDVSITLTGTDGDNDPLTFSIVTPPSNGTLINLNNIPDIVYRPNPDFAGNDSFTFTVDDGLEASDPATITLGGQQSNVAPQVNAGDNQQGFVNQLFDLNGTVTDDGLPSPSNLQIKWEATPNSGVNFSNEYIEDTTVQFSAPGIYRLTLTADDGALSDIDEVSITIQPGSGGGAGTDTFQNLVNPNTGSHANIPCQNQVTITDIQGRIIRTLDCGSGGFVRWDGRDNSGSTVASGIYLVIEDGSEPRKIVVLK